MLEGISRTFFDAIDAIASKTFGLALLPVAAIFHYYGFRCLSFRIDRIGHLAAEPDCFLKSHILADDLNQKRYFFLAPKTKVVNLTMLDYWRSYFQIIESPTLCWILQAMSQWRLMSEDTKKYILRLGKSQLIYPINNSWQGRQPLLQVSSVDRAWSDELFRAIGIPKNSWFVCVHVREAGYSARDESIHSYRNCNPQVLYCAIAEIFKRGGWCVRMGDPSMMPMEPREGLIDYAHHYLRSPRLDILLCARARFFLGNNSGLSLVSSVFGVPSALANLAPMSMRAFLPSDISIPKLLQENATGRILSYKEIFSSYLADFRYSSLYQSIGVSLLENTSEEISELVIQMLDQLEGFQVSDAEGEGLERHFCSFFRPGHYGYGSVSRIGLGFLRRHRELFA
jgi:putative glycosyltransferase (TIGR04372 family)